MDALPFRSPRVFESGYKIYPTLQAYQVQSDHQEI